MTTHNSFCCTSNLPWPNIRNIDTVCANVPLGLACIFGSGIFLVAARSSFLETCQNMSLIPNNNIAIMDISLKELCLIQIIAMLVNMEV